jgi:hypothetical protein
MSVIARTRGLAARNIVCIVACAALAACQTDNNLVTGSLGSPAPRAIAFESIDGPPPTVFARLVAQLTKEAEARKLPVVSRATVNAWRVRLYVAAHFQRKQATISWVGDVFDTRYNRAFRVSGEEVVSPPRKDVWALADELVLSRIAAKSLDAIMTQISAPEAAPSPAPAPAEPAARETPVADAGTVNALPRAEPRQTFVSQ